MNLAELENGSPEQLKHRLAEVEAELARSQHLRKLERLCLSGNRVSDRGAELLAQATLPALREVDVSGQHMLEPGIGPAGVEILRARFGDGCRPLWLSMPPPIHVVARLTIP